MKYFRHTPLAATTAIVLALGTVCVSAASFGDDHATRPLTAQVSIQDVASWWERVREASRLIDAGDVEREQWGAEAAAWASQQAALAAGDAALVWSRAGELAKLYSKVSAEQAASVVGDMAALADRAGALAHGEEVPALVILDGDDS